MLVGFVATALAQVVPPEPVTVGLGIGLVAPGALAPSVASARVRLTEGFTLSPTFGYTYATSRTGTGDDDEWSVTRDVDLGVGVEALGAVAQRGSALLQVVGGLEFEADTLTVDPDEPFEVRTEVRSLDLYYGLGVEWFVGSVDPHVSLSAHAMNPVGGLSRVIVRNEGAAPAQTDAAALGLVWEPVIRFMVHVYL